MRKHGHLALVKRLGLPRGDTGTRSIPKAVGVVQVRSPITRPPSHSNSLRRTMEEAQRSYCQGQLRFMGGYGGSRLVVIIKRHWETFTHRVLGE